MVRILSTGPFILSTVSIFLYGTLAATCFYHASKFWEVVNGRVQGGKYAWPKFTFFVVLGCAALLDLPTFLACTLKGGPSSCEWNSTSYAFCWCCHLMATCGYLYAVVTPSILWSDVVQV
jgi:hypothetical protein